MHRHRVQSGGVRGGVASWSRESPYGGGASQGRKKCRHGLVLSDGGRGVCAHSLLLVWYPTLVQETKEVHGFPVVLQDVGVMSLQQAGDGVVLAVTEPGEESVVSIGIEH